VGRERITQITVAPLFRSVIYTRNAMARVPCFSALLSAASVAFYLDVPIAAFYPASPLGRIPSHAAAASATTAAAVAATAAPGTAAAGSHGRRPFAPPSATSTAAIAAASLSEGSVLPNLHIKPVTRFRPMLCCVFSSAADAAAVALGTSAKDKAMGDSEDEVESDASGPESGSSDAGAGAEGGYPLPSIVVVETPWLNVIKRLPAAVARKRYGRT
jgi:hypothetical protein